ncbi:hypothetical protein BJX61DRAFT_86073 [Aspergillus egyptiacus]|nr:hypothetical protein BJX61DRAFT_86073 [Aspergillus egyptiacus]
MCTYWQIKYLCTCITDEWSINCLMYDSSRRRTQPNPHQTTCQTRDVYLRHDLLSFCEECYGKLDRRIRRDGVKKVLADKEAFPLGEMLGMVLVFLGDEGRDQRQKGGSSSNNKKQQQQKKKKKKKGKGKEEEKQVRFGLETYSFRNGLVVPLKDEEVKGRRPRKAEREQGAWKFRREIKQS